MYPPMQQSCSLRLLKWVFKAGKQLISFLFSTLLVAQTASLLMICARIIFSARSRVYSPVWLDQKCYKNSVPNRLCLLSHSVQPCRLFGIEWNVYVVYCFKFARQGPSVATGDGQPSKWEVLHSVTLSFARTPTTLDAEFPWGGCYIRAVQRWFILWLMCPRHIAEGTTAFSCGTFPNFALEPWTGFSVVWGENFTARCTAVNTQNRLYPCNAFSEVSS